jgi:hypothetical protein
MSGAITAGKTACAWDKVNGLLPPSSCAAPLRDDAIEREMRWAVAVATMARVTQLLPSGSR